MSERMRLRLIRLEERMEALADVACLSRVLMRERIDRLEALLRQYMYQGGEDEGDENDV